MSIQRLLAALTAFAAMPGCTPPRTAPPSGQAGDACVDGTCMEGLECEADVCVESSSHTTGSGAPATTEDGADPNTDDTGSDDEASETTGASTPPPSHQALDIVFVVDNSAWMGGAQHRLASLMPWLVDAMRANEEADVHAMVTTTDFGNPLCSPFRPSGYAPARGAPESRPCTDRLENFASLLGTEKQPKTCTDVCTGGPAPNDPFVAFSSEGDNANGDPGAALACLVPQGFIGCGYESPLENMLQALNPRAPWNQGGAGAIRPDADLAIVLLTNELDCSTSDWSVFADPSMQQVNPDNGQVQASSAICFNAGADCGSPDASGTYSGCEVSSANWLRSLDIYIDFLSEQMDDEGKRVTIVPLVGVSSSGESLYRTWRPDAYPVGDVLPTHVAEGIDASDLTFSFGPLGPGCSGESAVGDFVQALPPIRIRRFCEAIGEQSQGRCCMGSICDPDFSGALECLVEAAQGE